MRNIVQQYYIVIAMNWLIIFVDYLRYVFDYGP